jgi:hypothetical protein
VADDRLISLRDGKATDELRCLTCGSLGTPVSSTTVKALLTSAALSRLGSGHLGFCSNSTCPVVYFGPGSSTFAEHDLQVVVWQKRPVGGRCLCYCFGENEDSMTAELRQTGHIRAVERVRDHLAAGRCACELRNPRGTCCLRDLVDAEHRLCEVAHG